MIISIKSNEKTYEVALNEVNQWCGVNIVRKNKIIRMLEKYFSKSKYMEYEKKLECDIYTGEELLGRSYFSVHSVESREQIISQLKIGKNTLITKYILERISTDFESTTDIELINDILIKVFQNMNNEILCDFKDLMIDFETNKLFEIVQESVIYNEKGNNVNYLSTYNLILNYIKLIEKCEGDNGTVKLIIIKNIDHLLSKSEYTKLYNCMKEISKKSDLRFLCTISIEDYCIIEKENIEAITIINDEEFIMPPYQRIVEYIENNYPINRDVEEEWLIYNLRRCINRIGNRDASSEIPSEVIMKILNKSLQISKVPKYKANNIELNFINAIN